MKLSYKLAAAIAAAAIALPAAAQSGRNLEELKAETQARADRNAYPLIGLKPDEVREALGRLKSMDRDEWAASWSQIGDRYMARQDYHQAWLYYSFARWPVPNSPGKQRAYEKALEAYLAAAKKFDPPLEVMRVPYEGTEVVGYLRMPKGARPAPLVIAIAGLDSRKEEMAERFAPLVERGIAVLALDSPGTGQSGMKAAPGVEKSLSRVLDARSRVRVSIPSASRSMAAASAATGRRSSRSARSRACARWWRSRRRCTNISRASAIARSPATASTCSITCRRTCSPTARRTSSSSAR